MKNFIDDFEEETTAVLDTPDLEVSGSLDDSFEALLDRIAESDGGTVNRLTGAYALVQVEIHSWDGVFQAVKAEVSVDGVAVKQGITRPKYQLLPPSWKKQLSAIRAQAEALVGPPNGVPCRKQARGGQLQHSKRRNTGLRGIHAVYADKLEGCCGRLDLLATEMEERARYFSSSEGMAELRQHITDTYEDPHVRDDAMTYVPEPEELRCAFGIDWEVLPIGSPALNSGENDFRSRQELGAAKRMTVGNLSGILNQPREDLSNALGSLVNRLIAPSGEARSPRQAGPASISKVEEAVGTALMFDDVFDEEDLETLLGMRRTLQEHSSNMLIEAGGYSINQDDDMATCLASELLAVQSKVTSERSKVAGLKKLCRRNGVAL